MAREILIVEDDRRLAESCTRALEGAGYDVTERHDGASALEAVARMAPSLILLDLLLPKRDGKAVLAALAETPAASVPVIVMSGIFRGKQIERELIDAGASRLLEKPFEMSALIAAVQAAIGPAASPASEQDWSRARLEDVPPAELLWRTMRGGQSGTVYLQRGQLKKMLLLRDGTPVAIRSNAAAETLDRFLIARGQLDEPGARALAELRGRGARNGQALVQLGLMTVAEVEAAIGAQAAAKALELFAWPSGEAWLDTSTTQLPHASPLAGWTPASLLLRGVKYMPYKRIYATLSTFAPFGVVLDSRSLGPAETGLRSVRALRGALRPGITIGDLLTDHAPALYALWLMEIATFQLPGAAPAPTDEDPGTLTLAVPVGAAGTSHEATRTATLQDTLSAMRAQTYYALLGVARDADPAAIHGAYGPIAKRFHADRFAAESVAAQTLASAIYALLGNARDTLCNAVAREDYDRTTFGDTAQDEAQGQPLEAAKLLREAEDCMTRRDYAAAMAKAERLRVLDPDEPLAHALYGWAYFVVNRGAGGERIATKSLERAIVLSPESPRGYYYLAMVHKACDRLPQAQRLLRKALDVDPNHNDSVKAIRVIRMRTAKESEKNVSGGLFGFGRKKS